MDKIELATKIITNKTTMKRLSEDNKDYIEQLKSFGEDFEFTHLGMTISINRDMVSSLRQAKKTKGE